MTVDLGRRSFLKVSMAAGGGLLVGFDPDAFGESTAAATSESTASLAPNAWIRIDPDETVTIRVASSEMGQGVLTSLAMLVAEELEADWSKVRTENAPLAEAYNNPRIGGQGTGGSNSVRGYWVPLRQAGAAARELLIRAASRHFAVPATECLARDGAVLHTPTGRRASYGSLTALAAGLAPPDSPQLKPPSEFRLIGRRVPRVDTPEKVNGTAIFGQDVRVPGMAVATVLRCPVFGGSIRSFDAARARSLPRVRDVVRVEAGVAVVADDFWAAQAGREALVVEWDYGSARTFSTEELRRQFRKAASQPGVVAYEAGDAKEALRKASRTIDAVYEVPFLAHACMEPMNCTADVRSDGCDIWAPTQAQTNTRLTAARLTGLSLDRIAVHTTHLGGGFGRRSEQDFVADAVELSAKLKRPVQVMWTREDDMRHDFYRPAAYNHLRAALARNGLPLAWTHRIVGPSIGARRAPQAVRSGMDRTSTSGADNIPYAIAHQRVDYVMWNSPVPVGFWRSVGSSQNGYVTECFLDELAAAARFDPLAYRRRLLAGKPRHLRVLELLAAKAGWDRSLPAGRFRGVAFVESFGSHVAQAAEVSIEGNAVRVHRVVCAIDCGTVVNPDTVEAQMEGGIVYGLTAALKGEITVADGRVVQGNFDDYPLLRMDEMPAVEVHIVPSNEPPGGVGEPGTPPIAPAVANAVFAATGKPVRRLPIRL